MNLQRSYRKFKPQQAKIEELESKSPKFKRIYSEYELIVDELWELEYSDISNIPDDYINSMKQQTDYLEDEIDDWLHEDHHDPT